MKQKAYLFKDSLADAMLEFSNLPSVDKVNPNFLSYNEQEGITSIDVNKIIQDAFGIDLNQPEDERIALYKGMIKASLDKYTEIAKKDTTRFRLKYGDSEVGNNVTSIVLLIRALIDSKDSDAFPTLLYFLLSGIDKVTS